IFGNKELEDGDAIDGDCNLKELSENERLAYRIVFEDIADDRNFHPSYHRTNDRHDTCIVCALPVDDSLEDTMQKMADLRKHRKNIHKKIGTHIAEGTLDENDGITNDSNGEGHFSLFEYNGVDLSTKFEIVDTSI